MNEPGQFNVITDVPVDTLGEAVHVLASAGAAISAFGCDTEEKLIAGGAGARAMLVYLARTPVTRRVIESSPSLQFIARAGIGVDAVDLAAAREHGIPVTNLPDYCIDEVATHAVALLLDCARRVTHLDRHIRSGKYDYMAAQPICRLAGSTVGLVGFGRIARSAARKLSGFDVRLLAADPYIPSESIRSVGAEPVALDLLLQQADYACLFLPVTPETHHLLNTDRLALMKRSAYLINTSRGALIDQVALADALRRGGIAGAALDVLEVEPPPAGEPLLALPNVILTPHTAWYSEESIKDNRRQAAEDVVRFIRGEPLNHRVN